MSNPYTPPRADIDGNRMESEGKARGWRVDKVVAGQRLLIAVIVAHVLAVLSMVVAPSLGVSQSVGTTLVLVVVVVEVACFVAAIVGLLKISGGLEFSDGARVLLFIAMFVPVINLLTLLSVNSKATAFLKTSGYRVGLLGAK